MAADFQAHQPDGSFESALAFNNFLIETKPSAKAFYSRGNLYETNRDYDQAISDYSRAIELDPAQADAYYDRGFAYAWLDPRIQLS